MIITISGYPGAGKGTLRKLLAKEYSFPHISVGDLRREFARKKGISVEELNRLGETDPRTDREADEYQKEWGKTKKSFILEGRLSYYFFPESIRIFLDVAPEVGAERILKDSRLEETICKSIPEKVEANQVRCESDVKRYSENYGIQNCYNQTKFDIIIDTTGKTSQQVLDLAKEKIHSFVASNI